jgi:hypothetical protein
MVVVVVSKERSCPRSRTIASCAKQEPTNVVTRLTGRGREIIFFVREPALTEQGAKLLRLFAAVVGREYGDGRLHYSFRGVVRVERFEKV